MNDATTNTASDELVPSQWLDRVLPSDADVPERRLLVAVLIDAVRCLQSGGDRERTEVLAWVRAEYGPARLSFGLLCDGLGLDAESLARRLRTLAFDMGTIQRMHRARAQGKTTIVQLPTRKSPDAVEQLPSHTLTALITA